MTDGSNGTWLSNPGVTHLGQKRKCRICVEFIDRRSFIRHCLSAADKSTVCTSHSVELTEVGQTDATWRLRIGAEVRFTSAGNRTPLAGGECPHRRSHG